MKYKLHVALFSVWALMMTVSVTLISGLVSLKTAPEGRWVITHVLNPETSRGETLAQHLLARPSLDQYDELVILSTDKPRLRSALTERGYFVVTRSLAHLQTVEPGLELPFYFLTSPKGEGVFAGAYVTPEKDLKLIQSFFSGGTLSWFPMFGCGQSVRVQKELDPHRVLLDLHSDSSRIQ